MKHNLKVGDLVRHRLHSTNRFPQWKQLHIVRLVRPTAFQIVGCTGFYPPTDYEVVSSV